MQLSPELVSEYTTILNNPAASGFTFKPLNKILLPSDTITAQDDLYNDYCMAIANNGIPKLIFYIILNETYGHPRGNDSKGNAGYYLKVVA